ncbi:hypothetical protein BGZ57DRAFT_936511 [Hyaloscypha finlandica]|nr:hypothetical protein BGZ57DRAFT_936511 [Hyaloscypha finlandica]
MDTICDIDIDVQAALTNKDIRFYIRAQMMTDPMFNRWQQQQSIKDRIEERPMEDAGGSLNPRWAHKPAKIFGCHDSRILGNVPDMYHRELRAVLMLLSFSTRSMTIQEVAEATAVDLEEQSLTTDNRFGDPFDLLEVCSSLVSLTDIPGGTSS